eukprot:23013_1
MSNVETLKKQAKIWLDTYSCPEYLVNVEQLFRDIKEQDTRQVIKDEYLRKTLEELWSKSTGINSMLERTVGADADLAREDLARLHRLYSCVPDGNSKIADSVKIHIYSWGNHLIQKSTEIPTNQSSDHELIRSLIDLHDRFLRIVKNQFQSEQVFHKALKEAFEEFINKEYYTSALLARFANVIL